MVVGRAQHLAQAATSVRQGLELEIGRGVGLLALLLQCREHLPETREPCRVDGSLDQKVSVREEELALRLTQKPRGVTEDLFRCHGYALRVDDGGASRVSYARAGPGGIGPVGG